MQFKSVGWNELVIGDVVSIHGRLEELVRISPSGEGTALIFGSGHTEIQYDIRNRSGELHPHVRILRSEEGGKAVPVIKLGFNPMTRGLESEVLARYERRREEIRKHGPAGEIPDWMRD